MKISRLVVFVFCIVSVTFVLGQEVGNATFYHNRFHARRMANGQKYNKDSMFCAHKTYPFGTLLKVKNLRNGKEVIVKVTDRGPHQKRLTIDLSRAAAEELEIISRGIARVEITPYQPLRNPFKKDIELLPQFFPDSFSIQRFPH